ncbi:hypothetical protein ACQP1P_16995 [Dactylosporangium sp. CA-052675]|uniref:hypothetical protein n=1 Tax=Dactylosporangium sp. CA-052675 TaxID=3239927 RepID=UPI003D90A224
MVTDFTHDIAPAGPAATMPGAGGPIGSLIDVARYRAADFDGDGRRDTPAIPVDVAQGLPDPSSWVLPAVH